MQSKRTILALATGVMLGSCAFAQGQDKAIEHRVDALLKQMTLEEKVGQLNQLTGRDLTGPATSKNNNLNKMADIRAGKVGSMLNVKGAAETREVQAAAMQSRLKIPLLFALDVIHGYKTVFPIPLAESASWDLPAIELAASIAAREAAASGVHWTFAPMVDIAHDPRWGRVMEGAGEDTYLGSLIAKARVRGFQGTKPGGLDHVMATAKHFAAYGAAIGGRDYNAVDMSEQQLFETYLPPFKAAADAGVSSFMNSFNTLNGVPATGNAFLQRDILKGKWKYRGVVVSDWASIKEMVPHGYAADTADAAQKAMNAGSDIDMEGHVYSAELVKLVKAGKVKPALLDDAVRRVLYKKFELGLFDDPYRFSDVKREQAALNDPRHRAAARDIARKSLVLLKNDRSTLPLSPNLSSIAVIGPMADTRRDLEGAWVVKSDTSLVVSLLDGLRSHAAPGTKVSYAAGCESKCTSTDGFADAVKAASAADLVVLAVGETFDMSGEAKSRAELTLPGHQLALFDAIMATGKPVVVVIMGGRPLVFNSIADQAPSILFAWFAGAEGGNAIADVLFGQYNPSGKLPITFPRSVGQLPITYTQYNTGRPQLSNDLNAIYRSAYLDSPNTPRYAFGHGLSYTSFVYSDLALDHNSMGQGDKVTLTFTLTNSGKVAGEEVAQFYIRDMVASVVRPVKELKGFQKVKLEAGESKRLSFVIDKETLSFFNGKLDWVAEPGRFELMVGGASDQLALKGELFLK
ncbi:MAG: beta-glucosidase BglX [Pseudomonadota bacterium]